MPETPRKPVKIAPPTGTRDFYPREMLVRRYITDAWRRTALRHGFDEIDGPTFESAELYKVKSGEGILNEMFGVYSGKGLTEPQAQAPGTFDPRNPPFGLRPEFTPTLARMYAARAKQLPQPTKWFCVSNFFRAERPQRGRLREFWQWNCDVIGGEQGSPELKGRARGNDAETIAVLVDHFFDVGLSPNTVRMHISDREHFSFLLQVSGVPAEQQQGVLNVLDSSGKISPKQFDEQLSVLQTPKSLIRELESQIYGSNAVVPLSNFTSDNHVDDEPASWLHVVANDLKDLQVIEWCDHDPRIVRGLAYYTGTVFEVIAEGERAVAGGGRYDNLIELFGGPRTPACGFGMGDAVLGNLLEDRKLIPEGREMLEALSRSMPLRPDVFVIASPNPGCEELIVPTVARLRRGEESEKYKQGEAKPWSAERYAAAPLHARRSYKATKNVGKLIGEAAAANARCVAIIESAGDNPRCTIKHLDSGGTPYTGVPVDRLGERVGWLVPRS